ncbi:SH3 and cysteine-rich domain-containing protein 2 [Channa argus]|uniref:SH3 and cysteine-rich domain-containing protein 2 n=1 Tax=Channa argus TaxID=215402 RepID=A0A6G1QQ57_CHAAH|nr:SH3 and cysteine-rich domain-containing protein 2 [Channa argus]
MVSAFNETTLSFGSILLRENQRIKLVLLGLMSGLLQHSVSPTKWENHLLWAFAYDIETGNGPCNRHYQFFFIVTKSTGSQALGKWSQGTQDKHRVCCASLIAPNAKLQRLKRSLSFKSVMRSKSVDNFFQRSNGEARPTSALIPTLPPLPSPPPFSESPVAYEHSPSLSPSISPNPSLTSHSPSISPSLSITLKTQPKSQAQPAQPVRTHCFQEHIFRRPTSCEQCKHMIQGNSKQGLRCKACKLSAHLWCLSELSQQPCNGKDPLTVQDAPIVIVIYSLITSVSFASINISPSLCSISLHQTGAFKRNFSSPLLTVDPLDVVREAPAAQEADNGIVDPVYEALRYGTSLAQMSRSSFGSISESPCHEAEKPQDKLENQPIVEEENIPGMLTPPESEKADSEDRVSLKTPKRVEVHSIHTYVALYKFLPQEKNDLELQPGDRVQVTDDSNEDWWKRVRPGERVWKVTAGFHGNRDQGQMTVKEAQICVGKNEEIDGFLRLSSGKKRGLVPVKYLLEI